MISYILFSMNDLHSNSSLFYNEYSVILIFLSIFMVGAISQKLLLTFSFLKFQMIAILEIALTSIFIILQKHCFYADTMGHAITLSVSILQFILAQDGLTLDQYFGLSEVSRGMTLGRILSRLLNLYPRYSQPLSVTEFCFAPEHIQWRALAIAPWLQHMQGVARDVRMNPKKFEWVDHLMMAANANTIVSGQLLGPYITTGRIIGRPTLDWDYYCQNYQVMSELTEAVHRVAPLSL